MVTNQPLAKPQSTGDLSLSSELIAVYGTLRKGAFANYILKECKYIGRDRIKGSLYNIGTFPGLIQDNENTFVVVDLYELPNTSVLEVLDKYEGYYEDSMKSLYIRKKVITNTFELETWVYEYNGNVEDKGRISSGDWFNK